MKINFRTPNIDLTDEVRMYAEEKAKMIVKLLQNVKEEDIAVDIELDKRQDQQTGDIFRADITVHAGGERVHAIGRGETILAAIDVAKDEIVVRLSRQKKKRLDAFRDGSAKIKKMLRFWK